MQSAVSVRVLWVVLIGSLIRLGDGKMSPEKKVAIDHKRDAFVSAPWPVFSIGLGNYMH
jgi:hypothetical protein